MVDFSPSKIRSNHALLSIWFINHLESTARIQRWHWLDGWKKVEGKSKIERYNWWVSIISSLIDGTGRSCSLREQGVPNFTPHSRKANSAQRKLVNERLHTPILDWVDDWIVFSSCFSGSAINIGSMYKPIDWAAFGKKKQSSSGGNRSSITFLHLPFRSELF